MFSVVVWFVFLNPGFDESVGAGPESFSFWLGKPSLGAESDFERDGFCLGFFALLAWLCFEIRFMFV